MEFTTASWKIGLCILALFTVSVGYFVWSQFLNLWLKPLRAKRFFEAQGLKGMPYRFLSGNILEILSLGRQVRKSPMPQLSHDIGPRILPHYYAWSEKFGNPFFFWFGPQARVFVTEPEQGREVLSNKFGHYPKPKGRPDTGDLIGQGLVALEGEKWAQHRRIVSPAFFMEKLKAMTPTMAACTISMLEKWEAEIDKEASGCKEIEVLAEFRNLTADIIAHTAFGSSFSEGKEVFEIQHEQQIVLDKTIRTVYIPGSRFVPTAMNRYRWKLARQIQTLLREMIYKRMELVKAGRGSSYGNDLLGLMMAANRKELQGSQKNLTLEIGEIVDECKTFFFAGHETTSTLLTWAAMLLGSSEEWQAKAREEVVAVCGREEAPTAESVNSLKIVGMVLNETLRLYPPAAAVMRKASRAMRLGDKGLVMAEGSVAVVPIIAFHHDARFWGPDVHQFNPGRFAEGVAKACSNPSAFMPFSVGPRNCVGQTFAMLEAKVALATLLQRFAFRLSPSYSHSPTTVLTLQPQHGMHILVQKLPTPA